MTVTPAWHGLERKQRPALSGTAEKGEGWRKKGRGEGQEKAIGQGPEDSK